MNKSSYKRRYRSAIREAAAGENRVQVLAAAIKLLRTANPSAMSMEAVAKAAGVTRLTVYNQFGSRGGLLEAVFDELAREGGLARIPEAMALPDPRSALDRLIEIFCDFWAFDPAVDRLNQTAFTETEFAAALAARHERRRKALSVVLQRLAQDGYIAQDNSEVATDVLFALTSPDFFRMLSTRQRKEPAIRTLMLRLCRTALKEFQS
ncbi:TetR/AcrR family transcriptional regulator [Rhizobium jaguaris]|uniref:TetR/AcrR family transcriptional regulator n=1 Tax=Rhizobium jaguaris TaxID=1312183 RepID=UPI0039BEDBDA